MQNSFNVVYCLTSPSGKKYIGKTENFKKRMTGHLSDSKSRRNTPLYSAIRRHGWESFQKEILCQGVDDKELLSILEQEFIADFKQKGVLLYNLTDGGEGGFGWKPDDDWRKNLSERSIIQWQSSDFRDKRKLSSIASWDEERRLAASNRNKGAANNKAKLTEKQVVEIINLLKTCPISEIVPLFPVSAITIRKIKNNKSWTHIPR